MLKPIICATLALVPITAVSQPPPPPPPVHLPTTVAQCFNGGWQSFKVFKNQGDCVSYVATKTKNAPSLTPPPPPPPPPPPAK